MIGAGYFEARGRLRDCLATLRELGGQAGLETGELTAIRNLETRLREPFQVVVAGDPESGRATFIEGLFGEAFLDGGKEVGEDETHLFYRIRHGEEPRRIVASEALVECYLTADFLEDFQVIQVPVTERLLENHRELTDRYIPMADLVFLVFPAGSPWRARAWDLLQKVHRKWCRNIILVLQQSDLRGEEEVKAIAEHMRVTARQRTGVEPRVFAVSGREALLAKRAAGGGKEALKASGYGALESFVSETLGAAPGRRRKMVKALRECREIFEDVRGRFEGAKIDEGSEKSLRDRAAREIDEGRARAREAVAPLLDGLAAESTEGAAAGAEAMVASRWRRRGGDHGPEPERGGDRRSEPHAATEQHAMAGMLGKVRERFEEIAARLEAEATALWEKLAADVRAHFEGRGVVGRRMEAPDWKTEREVLLMEAESRVRRHMRTIDMEEALARQVRPRRVLRWILTGLAAAAAAAGVAAGTGLLVPEVPVEIAYAAGGVALGAAALAWVAGGTGPRMVTRAVRRAAEEGEERFGGQLQGACEEGTARFFRRFVKLEEQVGALGAAQRELYAPQLTQLAEIGRTFDELEERLGAGR